LRISSIKP